MALIVYRPFWDVVRESLFPIPNHTEWMSEHLHPMYDDAAEERAWRRFKQFIERCCADCADGVN